LPATALRFFTPNTIRLKAELLADLPDAPSLLKSVTTTFYPLATRRDLRLIVALTTVFFVVIDTYRRTAQIKRLLLAIAAIGAAVGLLALYQNVSGSMMLYGGVVAGDYSGPFMNHSHFGQFMNLSIGAMLALLLVRVGEISPGKFGKMDSGSRSQAALPADVWVLIGTILLSAATIFMSLTRGGVFSLVLAGAATAMVFARLWEARGRGTEVTILGIVAVACLVYASEGVVFERISSLRHVTQEGGGRWQILKDLAVAWRQFPLVGTGLGTHRFVFQMFDRSTEIAAATYAENEYAQLLEETGAIGLLLCLIFVAVTVYQYIRCVVQRRQAIHLAAVGLGYGLLAILLHSFSDFGQHVPANACLTAVFAGLLVRVRRFRPVARRHATLERPHLPSWLLRLLYASVPAALAAVILMWCLPAAETARRVEVASHRLSPLINSLKHRGWELGSDGEYAELLRVTSSAAQIAPDDVELRFQLNQDRWRSISRRRDRETGNLLLTERELGFTRRIVEELHSCRRLCPTFAPAYSLAGRLEHFILHLPEGEQHIRRGLALDACDPTSCIAAALLEAEEQHWEQAFNQARRAMTLDASRTRECLDIFLGGNRPYLAHDLVQGNRVGLSMLADMAAARKRDPLLVEQCRREANALILHEAMSPNAAAEVLANAAELYDEAGKTPLAVECYRRALTQNYTRVDWRLKLAELLLRSGQLDQARYQAQICLRLQPDLKSAENVLAAIPDAHTGKRDRKPERDY
jgi:tetratricopeptide (TPR) repeat protein